MVKANFTVDVANVIIKCIEKSLRAGGEDAPNEAIVYSIVVSAFKNGQDEPAPTQDSVAVLDSSPVSGESTDASND